MTADGMVAEVARHQNGLVTRKQALNGGLSAKAIEHRLATGRWTLKRRGVYVIAGAPDSERQAVLAVCLATGAMASHLTAASLWGMQFPRPEDIHVVGPHTRLEGVRSHGSESLVDADRWRIGAIDLTSPARTMVDCAGTVHPQQLGAVVDDGLRRGLVRLRELRACHERVDTGPGRRATLAMRDVLRERQPGHAAGDSQRETDIVRLLARSGLPAPVLGYRVPIGRHTYKLDIAWPEFLVCIEFDGWDTHRTFTAFHGDRQRGRRIAAIGWTILPVTSKTDLHELIGDLSRLLVLTSRSTPA